MDYSVEGLTAKAAELRAKVAAERRPKRVNIKWSEFYGAVSSAATGLPAIGAKWPRRDQMGVYHEVTVVATDGAYWSDHTAGQSGRWITIRNSTLLD